MVAINTIIDFAVLPVSTRIQASQKGYGGLLCFIWSIFMFKTTRVALGARAPQVMVIAKFVVVLSFLDVVQSCLVNLQRRIQAPDSRVPNRKLLAPHHWCFDQFWLKRESHLRGRTGALDGGSIRGRRGGRRCTHWSN